jgi:hypothetical protein
MLRAVRAASRESQSNPPLLKTTTISFFRSRGTSRRKIASAFFSVRPSDAQIFAATQEKLLQHYRQRQVIQPAVQDLLHFRISTCDGVTDDHDVGICRNILRAITFIERDVSPADLFQRPIVDEPLVGACRGRLVSWFGTVLNH